MTTPIPTPRTDELARELWDYNSDIAITRLISHSCRLEREISVAETEIKETAIDCADLARLPVASRAEKRTWEAVARGLHNTLSRLEEMRREK